MPCCTARLTCQAAPGALLPRGPSSAAERGDGGPTGSSSERADRLEAGAPDLGGGIDWAKTAVSEGIVSPRRRVLACKAELREPLTCGNAPSPSAKVYPCLENDATHSLHILYKLLQQRWSHPGPTRIWQTGQTIRPPGFAPHSWHLGLLPLLLCFSRNGS